MNAKVAGVLGLLITICVYLAMVTPESFLSPANIENLLKRTAMYGILGIGVAFVIITSGIDLSIGSIVCLVGCLLAVFLQVDYAPIEMAEVQQVRAEAREIVLRGTHDFSQGDQIRYYNGRLAQNSVLTIMEVRDENGDMVIVADKPLSRDDTVGRVAKAYPIKSFANATDDQLARINIDRIVQANKSFNDTIQPRDRILFVHPKSGLKEKTVLRTGQPDAPIVLKGSLGKFDSEWLAIPLARRQRMPIALGVLVVLGIALILGWLHGQLVTKQNLPPFIVTLCGLLFYRGISRHLVNDQPVGFGSEYESSLNQLATGKLPILLRGEEVIFGIPYPFFIMLILAIAAAVFLNRTIWGRYMLALGHKEKAARYSGIATKKVKVMAYVICTTMAAIGGMLFALDSNSVAPSSFGNFFELYAIAAAVLGGCSLRGGEGGIFGVIVGTALMQVLYNLIVLLKISDKLEYAIIGVVILLGVMADEFIRGIVAKRRARIRA